MIKKHFKNTIISFSIAGVLLTSSGSVHAALGDRVLFRGVTHNDVSELQQELKNLGYFTFGTTTTYFGSITEDAVRAFQRANGLVVDGSAGPATLEVLNNKISGQSPSNNTASNTPTTTPPATQSGSSTLQYNRVLRLGLSGGDVNQLQEALKSLGHLNIANTTQYFGGITRDAVMSFQRANGLTVDGFAGPATIQVINNILSGTISNKAPVNNAESNTTSNSTPTTQSGSSTLQYNRVLRLGVSGGDVNQLQEALKSLRHLNIANTTQYFGSITRDAVMSFQRANGLAVDGLAGPSTIQAINNILSGKASNNEPNRGGSRADIGSDIAKAARQLLGKSYVFGGNGPNAFDCSGLTVYVYRQFGISLPRTTTAQATVGTQVSKANLQIGDLVVFSNTYKAGPSHTGIYLGNGQFLHAANSRTGVIISDLNSGYYNQHFSYGRRLF